MWRLPALLGLLLVGQAAVLAQSGPARLAKGVEKFESGRYAEAILDLKAAQPLVPKLSDYIAYYLASANSELKDFPQVRKDLAPFRSTAASPLQGRAAVLDAKAATETGSPAVAIELLRQRYEQLPQPAGDFALADAYAAAQMPAQAAAFYQRVYYLFPLTQFAGLASKAIDSLKASMETGYPPPMPQLMLERGAKLLAAGEYVKARAEFTAMIGQLGGAEREIASVRVGAADYLQKKSGQAYRYLQSLETASPEANAERLYYIVECARRLNDDGAMLSAIQELAQIAPNSPWRLKALLSAGNRFLVDNQAESYEPLYRACYQSFPSDSEASYCHWKVAWSAYLRRRGDAADLLREQVTLYPTQSNATSAMYFLGRSAETSKDLRAARAYYDLIGQRYPGYYYGILANERLAQPSLARAVPAESTVAFLKSIAFPDPVPARSYQANAATARRIERFRLLNEAGLDTLAEGELRFAAKNGGQPHVLAMELARAAQQPHRGLRNMKSLAPDYLSLAPEDAPDQFWQLLFPMPFRSDLLKQSSASDLDPNMVAGLVRQESEFNPTVISRSNAYGLTQIVPSTGRELARKAGIRPFRTNMLFQPATNLRLGTRYLRSLLDQWGGKWEHTLASYNAGKSRVQEWITWANFQEPAEFVETIPFTQTRDYVQAVLRNAAAYRRIYGAKPSAEIIQPVEIPKASVTTTPVKRPVKKAKRPLRRS